MKVFTYFLYFCLLVKLSRQIEDAPDELIFENILGKNITHYQQIIDLQNSTDITYLLFLYKNSSVKSRIIGGYLVNIAKQLEFIAEILKVDCNNFITFPNNNICEETSNRDSFPKIKLLVPPDYKINPYTGQRMPHRDVSFTDNIFSEPSLYNYITKNVPSYAKVLNDLDFNDFISENYLYNKIILFTDKQRQPLMFRGLSTLFFDRIEFGIVNNTQKDLIEYFKVKQFPTIIAIITNDKDYPSEKPTYFEYNGGINIKEIKEFIERFAYPVKRYELEAQGRLTKNKTLSDLFTVLNKETIDKFFIINAEKNMILYFALDTSVYSTIEKFARETHGFINYGFVDCNGWEEVCKENFRISDFPAVRFLKPGSKVFERELFDVGFNYDKILYNFFNDFKSNIKEGKIKDIMPFIQKTYQENRIPVVYISEGESINPGVFFFSNENIAKHFEFFVVKSPKIEEIKQNKLPNPPALLVFIKKDDKDKVQILHYKGEITFVDLYAFFYKILKSQQISTKGMSQIAPVDNINSFNLTCYSQDKACMIVFMDTRPVFQADIPYLLKNIEEVAKLPIGKDFVYISVNVTCHDELAKKFNINLENLPGFVLYFPQTEQYSIINEQFTKDILAGFMEKFMKWELPLKRMKFSEIIFRNMNCSEVKEREKKENTEEMVVDEEEIKEEIKTNETKSEL